MRIIFAVMLLIASFISTEVMSASATSCANYSNNVCTKGSSIKEKRFEK